MNDNPLKQIDPFGLAAITGSWINPPKFNINDYGVDNWELISPGWSWWGYMKFVRLFGHANGYINVDVKCHSDDGCPKDWEVHSQINVSASGYFDVGLNLYAIAAGLKFGPWVGASVNIAIAGAALLQAEYHYLSLAEAKAGPIISAVLKGGPTAICLGSRK